MIILTETARMSLTDAGVVPGINLTTRGGWPFAVLHLTKGSRAVIAGRTVQGAGAGAVKFSGSVDAITERGDSTTDWEFNFIQLLYQPVQRFVYAGFDRSDGGMILDVTEPTPQYRLDSDPARAPFPISDPANSMTLPPTATTPPRDVRDRPPDTRFSHQFEDHPNVSNLFLVNKNYLTGADNYLVRAQVERHFFTAFVAKDKLNRRSSDYIILAYTTWKTIWDAMIWWYTASKIADVAMIKKEYKAEPIKYTYPPSQFAKLVERPTTNRMEMFSEINLFCFQKAFNATANNGYAKALTDWPQGETIFMHPV
jgi:hypothetical protein